MVFLISIVSIFNTISISFGKKKLFLSVFSFPLLFSFLFCSKRRFNEQQAEEWWNQNKDKVLSKYSPPAAKNSKTGSSITPPHAEENSEALPSS